MKTRGKYNKTVELDYRFVEDSENDEALVDAFDLMFKKIIQDRKRLLEYFKSEDFTRLRTKLLKRRSVLSDYLLVH